jgi:fucose 4-O-acetylase-like acetyltransferase
VNPLKWNWVDIAKGITILMVAGYHATLGTLNDFVTTWFMPPFFIMSGYLLNIGKWTAPGMPFVKNRFQRIMVPYFVSYAIYFFIWLAEGWLGILQLKPRLTEDVLLGIFYGNGNTDWMLVTPMWFLPCLFVAITKAV